MLRQLFITGNFFDKCLKAFIFLLPIIWLSGFTQSSLQMLFFNYGTIILFGLGILLPAKREFQNYNLFLFIIFAIVISSVRNPHSLSISLLNVIFGSMLYFIVVRNAENVNNILKIFVWLGLLNIGVSAFQAIGIDFIYREKVICGLMTHKNHLAVFLALIAPILLSKSRLFLLLLIPSLILTHSLSGILGLVIGAIILIYFRIKNNLLKFLAIGLSLAGLLAATVIFWQGYKLDSRLPVWNILLKEVFINPFVGKGLDSFKMLSASLTTDKIPVILVYNEYINAFFEWGIIPVLILMYSLFRYYKDIFIYSRASLTLLASIAAFLAMMCFQDPLHLTRLAVPFLIIVALFEVSCIDNKEDDYGNQCKV